MGHIAHMVKKHFCNIYKLEQSFFNTCALMQKKKSRVTTKIKYMYTVCIKSLPPLSQRYARPFIQNKLKSPSPNQSCIFIILLYYLLLETDMALHLKKKWKSLQPRTIWDKFGWIWPFARVPREKLKIFMINVFFHYLPLSFLSDDMRQPWTNLSYIIFNLWIYA